MEEHFMSNINSDLLGFIFKRYGYKLTESEYHKVINWYQANDGTFENNNDADKRLRKFLADAFPGKKLFLFEEDTSNISYLLTLLDKSAKTK